VRNVEELARYDPLHRGRAAARLRPRHHLRHRRLLRDYAEGINASPERLAEIEDRLALLDRLKRKYGKTVAEVIAFGEDVARKLAEVEDRDEILKTLRADLEKPPPPTAKPPPPPHRRAQSRRIAKLAKSPKPRSTPSP
jgi:DNA repair protein RecN (Recombination protein N)